MIIDPVIESSETFPAVLSKHASISGREAWGRVNSTPYDSRGWCCVEFSVALKNNRIVNKEDPEVQEVLAMRDWPETVLEYAAMMDDGAPRPVLFTSKVRNLNTVASTNSFRK